MGYRFILAIADGAQNGDGTLRLALKLGKKTGAAVEILHPRPDPATLVPIVGEGMSGALAEQMVQSMTRAVEARAKAARDAFDRVTAGLETQPIWREQTGSVPDTVAAAGRLADLIVAGRAQDDDQIAQAATLDAALFDTGRPVLVVPPGAVGDVGNHIAIAWNGSAQVSRSVAAALPLLQKARQVTIFSFGKDDAAVPAGELARYLTRHEISAAVLRDDSAHGIGPALLEKARAADCDMIVMGAYGHSRLREMILGGATRYVLAHTTLPLLMAH